MIFENAFFYAFLRGRNTNLFLIRVRVYDTTWKWQKTVKAKQILNLYFALSAKIRNLDKFKNLDGIYSVKKGLQILLNRQFLVLFLRFRVFWKYFQSHAQNAVLESTKNRVNEISSYYRVFEHISNGGSSTEMIVKTKSYRCLMGPFGEFGRYPRRTKTIFHLMKRI